MDRLPAGRRVRTGPRCWSAGRRPDRGHGPGRPGRPGRPGPAMGVAFVAIHHRHGAITGRWASRGPGRPGRDAHRRPAHRPEGPDVTIPDLSGGPVHSGDLTCRPHDEEGGGTPTMRRLTGETTAVSAVVDDATGVVSYPCWRRCPASTGRRGPMPGGCTGAAPQPAQRSASGAPGRPGGAAGADPPSIRPSISPVWRASPACRSEEIAERAGLQADRRGGLAGLRRPRGRWVRAPRPPRDDGMGRGRAWTSP